MAKFRYVYTSFWNDSKVMEEMTPEDKYFYMYLLTNSYTTQIGIYTITKKVICFETGYSIESVNSLVERFEKHHKLIRYNPVTREMVIKNWGKYNLNKGGKPIEDCIRKELKEVKDTSLISFVIDSITNEKIKSIFLEYIKNFDLDNYSNNDTSTIRERHVDDTHENMEKKSKYSEMNTSDDTYYDTNTVRVQKEKQKEKEKTTTTTVNNNLINKNKNIGCSSCNFLEDLIEQMNECGFRNISKKNMDKYRKLVELHGLDKVKKALEIADDNDKHMYNYVEGILKNWNTNKTSRGNKQNTQNVNDNSYPYKPVEFNKELWVD